MKKFIFVITAFLSAYSCTAQFKQGNIFLGTDFHYSSVKSEEAGRNYANKDTITNYQIAPHIGAMVTNKIAMGIGFLYGKERENYGSDKNSSFYETKISQFSFNTYIRTFKSINENLAVFAHNEISFGSGSYKENGVSLVRDYYGNINSQMHSLSGSRSFYQLGIKPGIIYRLGGRIALEGKVGFVGFQGKTQRVKSYSNTIVTSEKGFIADFDLSSARLGIVYVFGK